MAEHTQSESREVFISYHSNSAGEEVRKICAALEGCALVEQVPLDQLTTTEGTTYVGLHHRVIESSRDLGDYETAISWGKKCLPLSEQFYTSTLQNSLGWAEFHLARALCMGGDLDESERYMKHALSLFQELGDEWMRSLRGRYVL